ncbi:hypothetical protein PHYSODRAFT_314320 [Phytophthora sojae]|uniref:Kinesin motor domain-containing protein n=1 Tax=Phytophthora sojae (strain P6497) TaxID=1094619 RepID=G4ZF73_PHYSP|nr:hypothetical protein PHYSODRAFT_314320 [Phytophthora sojae]EGZ16576.1 hypothetical protein PHYSODRAFT_314320 [Phytophthora sojae]|eukprot:XP_009525634.1 hypothetical protein PHYSODRAFT_314320 [Phytophthora sojae]
MIQAEKCNQVEQLAGFQYNLNEKVKQVAELQHKTQEIRKSSHNTIQELRGNVRVVVRARPAQGSGGILSFGSDGARLTLSEGDQGQSYEFDRVFSPSSTQDQLEGLVQSAIDGYNVALFAYGQTGAGKTHTMLGSDTGQQRGVIPRALEKIFQETSVLTETGWTFKVQVSAVQVFKEEVHDLLCTGELVNLRLIESKTSHQVAVQGLTTSQVRSSVEALDLLTRATGRRNTASTAMNQSSSRLHFVFMVRAVGSNPDRHDSVDGLLYLVDLAGSENAGRFQVPYRNSRLTRLLEPCLSNGGKVQLVVNLSADAESARETSQSLRFAATAKSCALG